MLKPVTSWSYSAWHQYEECPAKYKFAKLDKEPDPQGPALIRGNRLHKEAEDYVRGKRDTPSPETASAKWMMDSIKAAPNWFVEQEWAWKKNWSQVTEWRNWKEGWFRAKCDAGVSWPDNYVDIVDWKSGKKYASNSEQVELFALSAMIRFPYAEKVMTKLVYFDSPSDDMVIQEEFDAKDRDKLKEKWKAAIVPMFNDQTYAPRPSTFACKHCNFAASKGGKCRFG